jgi:hypothetical protein
MQKSTNVAGWRGEVPARAVGRLHREDQRHGTPAVGPIVSMVWARGVEGRPPLFPLPSAWIEEKGREERAKLRRFVPPRVVARSLPALAKPQRRGGRHLRGLVRCSHCYRRQGEGAWTEGRGWSLGRALEDAVFVGEAVVATESSPAMSD